MKLKVINHVNHINDTQFMLKFGKQILTEANKIDFIQIGVHALFTNFNLQICE